MSLSAAVIDALLETGATREQIAAAVKADIAERDAATAEKIEKKRAGNRERQQRKRERDNAESRVTGVTARDTPSSDKDFPQTPLQNNSIPSPPYSPPASRNRGTRLADDFDAPADWIEWAMSKRKWSREDAIDEAECFTRYWQSKPGREACKLDWPKTWQNWVTNSRRGSSQAPPSRTSKTPMLDHLTGRAGQRTAATG